MCRPAATTAESPFDDANADIILHTSDHVDFRVFRLVLTLASPFFQGMFALPQPSDAPACASISSSHSNPNAHNTKCSRDSTTDGPPSIDVPEDSQTLDTLFRFLYPNTHAPPFHDLPHAHNVALAASKYDMPIALDKIADKVQAQYVASDPLHVYFIACRMGWEGVAQAAANFCLDPALMPGEELDCDSLLHYADAGVAYHRLQTYRKACTSAVEKRLDDMNLSLEDESCESDNEGDTHGGISRGCLSRWSAQYVANIKLAMSKCPRKDTLDDTSSVPVGGCVRCNIDHAYIIATAQSRVASEVEDVLSQIKLRFSS